MTPATDEEHGRLLLLLTTVEEEEVTLAELTVLFDVETTIGFAVLMLERYETIFVSIVIF